MAGNTKLLGFGVGNKVTLTRWGGKHDVEISRDSWKALQDACVNSLPTTPPERGVLWKDSFHAAYDENMGRVNVNMDPATAKHLAYLIEGMGGGDVTSDVIDGWVTDLKAASQAHEDYHNREEPGVVL